MDKRITLISIIDIKDIENINELLKEIKFHMCKVPYGIDNENRYKIDNLPYHFTIFATDKENEEKMVDLMEEIENDSLLLQVNKVGIMSAKENSYCLYLEIKKNEKLKKLQSEFFEKLPNEKNYNPDNFIFHITLHIDKDYDRIIEMGKMINRKFEPFTVTFNKIGLFDYPSGKEIKVCDVN